LVAALRTPGKPSVAISTAPADITGSIGTHGEKPQSLTDEDKTARPGQPASESAQSASQPVRAANIDNTEKIASQGAEEDRPARRKHAAAKPKPHIRAAATRQEVGANFRANNPVSFPFFGAGLNAGQ
jgi:hypothetical protein